MNYSRSGYDRDRDRDRDRKRRHDEGGRDRGDFDRGFDRRDRGDHRRDRNNGRKDRKDDSRTGPKLEVDSDEEL